MNRMKTIIGKVIFFFARAHARTRSRVLEIGWFYGAISLFAASIALAASPVVNTAIKNISSQNLDLCLSAIDALGKAKEMTGAIALAAAYESENRVLVKRLIVEALGQIGRAEGRAAVIKALGDADAEVRQSAVISLSLIGGRESDQAIVKQAANEQNKAVKLQMMSALSRSRGPRAFGRLQQLKDDDDAEVSDRADQEIQKRIKGGGR